MDSCSSVVTPSSDSLSPLQQIALNWIAFWQGRDVVFAVDVTASVRLDNQGRLRVEQILRDAINRGDTVYIVPFAETIQVENVIEITNEEAIEKSLNQLPLNPDPNRQNTDIQNAELFVYQFLAQQNHCRLVENDGIREQAVVWLTDAPLETETGEEWIETPADSPFRDADSSESELRQDWLEALPREARSRRIPTGDDQFYDLTIVDIPPTLQEFCTPAPSGEEVCFINRYLLQQLWLPTTGLIIFLASVTTIFGFWYSWQKPWRFTIELEEEEKEDYPVKFLKSNQRLAIGDQDASATDYIECPGNEIRAYLERKRNQLYLIPTQQAPIFYKDKEVTTRTKITGKRLRLNCPQNQKDFEFVVKID
ncbi:MAG: VWA domain-containing protein [Halothece sp.]